MSSFFLAHASRYRFAAIRTEYRKASLMTLVTVDRIDCPNSNTVQIFTYTYSPKIENVPNVVDRSADHANLYNSGMLDPWSDPRHQATEGIRFMGHLEEIGEADGWRCWLCDEPVDRDMPSSDPRAPSVDGRITKARAKKMKKDKIPLPPDRIAHVGCNTGKGTVDPVIPWPDHLIVVDPAPILATAERLERKGGREAMARCSTNEDAEQTAAWLVDRMSRLHPGLAINSRVDKAGPQFLVSLYV